MIKCIDISEFQDNVDYNKVKESGIEMAILRIGYTGYGIRKSKQIDKQFETHYNGFKNVSIKLGVYWYSCAYTEEEAMLEANKAIEYLKNKSIELPIFIDVEDNHNVNLEGCAIDNQITIGKHRLTNVVKAFCGVIEKNNYKAGIYASAYWLNTRLDMKQLTIYDIWVAHWNTDKPGYSGDYAIWQYTSKGQVLGIDGNVDLNYVYKSYGEVKLVETFYIVKAGDTLSGIANKYKTNYKLLAEYNNISNPNLIYPKQKILIPKINTIYYTVKAGDNLINIAKKHNVNYLDLYNNNKQTIGDNPNLIHPNQVLKITTNV